MENLINVANQDREITDLISFDKYFPALQNIIDTFEEFCGIEQFFKNAENVKEFNKVQRGHILPKIKKELEIGLPGGWWHTLCQQSHCNVALHTINVLYRSTRDPIYINQFTKYEQNIIKWSALLHDICKRGTPIILGKDHIHPFVSAAATLEIFAKLGIIQAEKEDIDKVCQLILNSKQDKKFKLENLKPNSCKEVHSHHLLKEIFHLFWTKIAPRGSFADLVIRLVMFH